MPLASPGGDVVAFVDLAQADTAGHRRDDVRVPEIELGGADLGLVGRHRALVLPNERLLRVELLLGDQALRQDVLEPLQIQTGIGEQRLVAFQIALHLLQGRLIGARIDLGQKIALVDELTLLEGDVLQLTADLGLDGHGGQRRHRAQGGQFDGDVPDAGRGHRDRRSPSRAAPLIFGLRLSAVVNDPGD